MTPEQSAIVWDATLEAAKDMEGLALHLTPRRFEQRQVDADANKMVRRFLVKNLTGKIPALEAAKATAQKLKKGKRKRVPLEKVLKPKIPVDRIPRPIIPRVPKVNWGWLLLLAAIAMSGDS